MPRVYLPWMVVIALEVLLIGSLPTTWNGADSFSARYLTSSAPLIAFGVLTILCAAGRVWRPLLMAAVAVCCLFTVLFAIQFRLDLIPRNDRLTAAECFTDKLRLYAVYKQKVAVKQARDLLLHGSPEAAVATLEKAQAYGENREVLSTLSAAYHATGRDADARRSAGQLDRLVQARLW
jgi:hypothetical protein